MENAELITQEIIAWANAHAWYGRQAKKLKPKHIAYMGRLVARMENLDEYAMNRAWAEMPSSEREADAGARSVAELVCSYCSSRAR